MFGWAGALAGAGHGLAMPIGCAGALTLVSILIWWLRGPGSGLALVAGVVVFVAVATAAGVRYDRVAHNPLTELARLRAGVVLTGRVADDPRAIQGRFGQQVLVRLDVREVEAAGRVFRLREPVL